MKIACIDFETANPKSTSICAAAVATFENGELTESVHWLVRPPRGSGYFFELFIKCHGLTWFDVRNEPEFAEIAPQVLDRLAAAHVVIAHNAAFDMRHLRATLRHFHIRPPHFRYLCTCNLARRVWPQLPNHQLETVAAHIGHTFLPHIAEDDAETAGRALIAMMSHTRTASPTELAAAMGIFFTAFSME